MLPDGENRVLLQIEGVSQCTYRCVVLPDLVKNEHPVMGLWSQCTYRCVVLPDGSACALMLPSASVSMHLQVRGAP